ncbi:hypothetical protein AGMMS49944_05540 [Spirochaetia bacterium]|nr:hypothetical protein AGMMS49944_05540 [Spirochaetia bacterium]
MDETKWLCPHCVYGHMLRVVKNEQHIPTHTEYLCADLPPDSNDILSAPEGPGGWDGKNCQNFINNQTQKVCQFYTLGKSEKELYAYDEYDSWGSGRYFTDDVMMCDRYTYSEAEKEQNDKGLKIFLVTITKDGKLNTCKIEIGEM